MMACLCASFCFFKQKTAYELRISDWSSDVCSSDLAELRLAAQRLLGDEAVGADRARVDLVVDQVVQLQHIDVANSHLAVEEITGAADIKQIGRASCRARVCQYV